MLQWVLLYPFERTYTNAFTCIKIRFMINSTDKFKSVSSLIGRDDAKARIHSIFEEIGRGEGKILLVPGHSGTGKTSLVQWLAKPVRLENGLFVTGKFNQYHQNTPYYAVGQALSALWHKIYPLIDTDPGLEARLREALGDLGFLLGSLIPEIKTLFGEVPRSEEISYVEARHRFTTLIRNFLKTVCLPEHPVVVFIDDWQWADSASLELLRALGGKNRIRYFLLIASFRDEEVDATHPLSPVIADLNRRTAPPEVLEVKGLKAPAVKKLIEDALEAPLARPEAFIDEIIGITRGNPFHIKTLISFLYDEGALRLDPGDRLWHWHLEPDRPRAIVDLFARRISRLEPESRELISMAACIGNFFDLDTLGLISHLSGPKCRERLTPLLEDGLVLVPGNENQAASPVPGTSFMFLHDKVRQAAYLMIDADKRPGLHLEIGRLLLAGLTPDETGNRLFEILEHLNAGGALICEPAELGQMVDLNMAASSRAKAATAFTAMLGFNRAAFNFAARTAGGMEAFWRTDHSRALALHRNLAESEFLEGDRKRAEGLIRDALAFTTSSIERADTLNILIIQYTLLARYKDAISAGRKALAEFDIFLPEHDFERFRDQEIDEIREKLSGQAIPDLYELPLMTDPEMLTAIRLLITLGPPCYRTHQRLWSVIVPKVVNLTLTFGHVPQIGYSHTAFGGLLCWVNGDYRTAKAFGDLAERIMNAQFGFPSDQSVFYLMIGSSIRHWFNPLPAVSEDYIRAFEEGRRSGNLQYAAYGFGHNMYCRFFQGMALGELIADTERSLSFSRSRMNHWAVDLLEGGLLIFESLSDPGTVPDRTSLDDHRYLNRVETNQNSQVLCIYKIFKSFYHMLLEDYPRALSLAKDADTLLYTVGTQGLLPWAEHVFIRFLILSGMPRDKEARVQPAKMAQLRDILRQLGVWSECCPENYTHKRYLAAAEIDRMEGRTDTAILHYDRAVAAARENGFVQWEGIANERAARFWDSLGNGHLAQAYWQQAYACFHIWGASAKLTLMENAFRGRLGTWYTAQGPKVSGQKRFCQRHIELLKERASARQELEKQQSASKITEELADAVNRLRIESAERRQAEAELKKTMEENRRYIFQLEQKNRELDEFTYIASHDLQEPLRKMIAFSKLLVKDVGPDLNEQADKDISYIIDAAQRMEVLIQDLLQLSRTGREAIPLETVCLNQCLDEVAAMMQSKFEETGAILVRTDLPEVRGDKTLLSLVFQNLIQNALKFNDKYTPVIEATCVCNGGSLVFGIRDNGIGIKPQYARQIFQPFKRLHGRFEYPGTGIGLAICKKAIERHGGEIWVDSVFGEFAHFQFTLNIK